MVDFCAGMLEAIDVFGLMGLLDMTGYLLKEVPRLPRYRIYGNVLWLTVLISYDPCAVVNYRALASRIRNAP